MRYSALLLENGFFLLQEVGGNILIEPLIPIGVAYGINAGQVAGSALAAFDTGSYLDVVVTD
jgi:hypothetical protein